MVILKVVSMVCLSYTQVVSMVCLSYTQARDPSWAPAAASNRRQQAQRVAAQPQQVFCHHCIDRLSSVTSISVCISLSLSLPLSLSLSLSYSLLCRSFSFLVSLTFSLSSFVYSDTSRQSDCE